MSIRIPLPAALRTPDSWPLPLPGLVLGLSPTARLTEEDVKSLETVRRIWALLEPQVRQQSSLAGNFLKPSKEILVLFCTWWFSKMEGMTTLDRDNATDTNIILSRAPN